MDRAAARGIEQRGRVAAMHGADRVVRVLARDAREHRPARFHFDELEIERYENARLAPRGDQRAQL